MTTMAEALGGLTWDPPGPGTWNLDTVHWPRPATAHMDELFPSIEEGFASSARDYGWLAGRFNLRTVNRFTYSNVEPAPVDEFPSRFERCEQAFATKRWRAEIDRWDTEVKPAALAKHKELLAVDPAELTVGDLVAYLHRCRDHHRAMWLQHHTFNGTQMIPVGDFLVSTVEWTGLPPGQIAALLRGASPISRGASPEASAVAAALSAAPGAIDVLGSNEEPRSVLDRLRNIDDHLTGAVDEWLLITENRPVDGFDVSDPTGAELPEMLVQCLRRVLVESEPKVSSEEIAWVRSKVPAEHRADFDDRLDEARRGYRIRDERGIFSDALACGIMRRAFLAAGSRLVATGQLPARSLVVEATVDEVAHLLDGEAGLVPELESRAAYRRAVTIADAPAVLGDPPTGPPGFDGLPPAVVRMMSALVRMNLDATGVGETRTDGSGRRVLQGIGANTGTHTGVARVVHTPDDFDRLQDGDVIVTIPTGEAFNVSISMVSALLTDQGHLMSHAAITAREFGIPCIVGAAVATTQIPDGAVVSVDGEAGTITWS
jgi:pyruvate,water dikinase